MESDWSSTRQPETGPLAVATRFSIDSDWDLFPWLLPPSTIVVCFRVHQLVSAPPNADVLGSIGKEWWVRSEWVTPHHTSEAMFLLQVGRSVREALVVLGMRRMALAFSLRRFGCRRAGSWTGRTERERIPLEVQGGVMRETGVCFTFLGRWQER